jgi:hypothetical protein
MSKFFDDTMQGLLEAAAISYQNLAKALAERPIEDVITISYEERQNGDISLLMVSRKEPTGMKILRVFKEDEADELYRKLIGR